ncbi:hypothetical protein HMI56_003755 [Coelomomyces lativittatus]|nr:hypothetical protein HMI56_003755 [Coelomomyces lativittatus]
MHKLFLKGGTLADKISVLTLSIQHSPVHNLTALEKLVHLVTKKNRKEALMALSALKDLFTGTGFLSTSSSNFSTNHQHMKNKKQHPVNHEKTLGGGGGGLLPSNRRLLPFHLQPIPFHEHDHALKKDKSSSTLSSSDLNEKKWWPQWALYVFEDHLKKLYYQFVCALEQLLKDPLLHIKQQALDCVMALLVHGPEQEVNLLQLCIHKLGDPMSKLAALTSHKLLTLIHVHHPAMKPVVFEACRLFLLNETTPLRAHYYTLITLNQFKLSAKEPEFVQTLVHFYFQKLLHQFQMTEHLKVESKKLRKMTKVAKKKKQRIQKRHGGLQVPSTTTSSKLPSTPVVPSKLTQLETLKLQHETLMKHTKVLSAILTGLHRALPYLQLSTFPKTWLPHVDLLFQWTRHSDLVLQLHALHVLYLLQRHPLPRRYFTPFCTSLHQYLLKLTYSPMVPQHVQSMTLTFLKQVFFHLFPPSESPYATTPRNPQNGKSKVTRPSEEEGDDEEDAPKSTTLLGLVSCLLTLCLHHSHPGFVMAVLQCLFTTVFRRHPWVWHNLHLMAPSVQEEVSKVSLQVSLSTPFFQVSMLAHHMHPSIRWYIQHRFLGRPSPHHGLPSSSSSSSSSSSTVLNPKEDDEDASDPFSTYAFLPFLDTFISKKLKIPVPSHPSSSSSSLEDPRRPLPFSHARKVNMEPSVGSHVHPSHQQGSGVDGHQRAYVEFLEPLLPPLLSLRTRLTTT